MEENVIIGVIVTLLFIGSIVWGIFVSISFVREKKND